jgi:uncharacterized protein (TIGR02246 family)
MRTRSLLAAVAVLLAAAPAAAQQRPDMNVISADRAAIEQAARDYEAAWAKGDATAIAVMYSKDALSIGGTGMDNGREDIRQNFAENFAGAWKGSTIKIRREPVEFVRPDVAIGYGAYTVKRGSETIADGKYLSVWVKENGKWHIRANQAIVPARQEAGTR